MSATAKRPLTEILPTAERLLTALAPFCRRIELAGSLRRQCAMIGDIELVAIPRRPANLFGEPLDGATDLDRFLDARGITFTKRGQRYQQFQYGPFKVDLFLPTPETWGSVFTIRTGSWEFSRWLVTSEAAGGAKPEAITFADGRLHAHGRLLVTPEEADVFAALGLAWIEPQLRVGPVATPIRVNATWGYA